MRVASLIDERQGTDISILDVTGPLVIADHFVLATVRNDRHGNSLAREIIQTLKADGVQRRNAAGLDGDTGWVLLDFNDLVVHLFVEESREFYNLESLWSDAPKVPFTPSPAQTHSTEKTDAADDFPHPFPEVTDLQGPTGTR